MARFQRRLACELAAEMQREAGFWRVRSQLLERDGLPEVANCVARVATLIQGWADQVEKLLPPAPCPYSLRCWVGRAAAWVGRQ